MIRNYKEYLNSVFSPSWYDNSPVTKKDDSMTRFHKKASAYFTELTKNDAGYYSDNALDYNMSVLEECREFVKEHSWQEILDYCFNRITTGVKICHAHDLGYTCGNSRYDQFSFYGHMFTMNAFVKVIYDILISLNIPETDKVSYTGNQLHITRELEFGHKAHAFLIIDITNVYIKKDMKLGFVINVRCSSDPGFYDELYGIANKIKEELREYKKNCQYLKIKLR